MELKDFIEKFAEQFDDTDVAEFAPNTKFRCLEEWSSLSSLSIIAMIDGEYDVMINGNDIRESETIEDLYTKVKSRI